MTCDSDRWQWQETVTGDSDRGQMTGDRWKVVSVTKYQMLYSKKDYKEQNVQERYSLLICIYNMEQLSSWVVSIQILEEQILGSNPHRVRRRMNIYTFEIFTNHCMDVDEIDDPGRYGLKFRYLEIGPLNLPEFSHMAIVKEAVCNI